LLNSLAFTGTVSGFTGTGAGNAATSDKIDLKDINFSTASESYLNNVLTVTDGTHTANINFVGSYVLANFHLLNDGSAKTLVVDPPASGPDEPPQINVSNGATQELGGAVSQNIAFEGNSGTLELDSSASFTGQISGFSTQDGIDLSDIGFGFNSTLGYSASGDNTATLTVSDGAHTANIALLGQYAASSFATDSDGHDGTLITSVQPSQQQLLTQPHA
jgi:hypothetical protein